MARAYKKKNRPHMTAIQMKRHAAKMKRTPAWANQESINLFYAEAKRLTLTTGVKHAVDHVIPLQGKNVSGLHVENNLQVITHIENAKKWNRYEVAA